MTWSKQQKRWFKEYKGRKYAISPRQLGAPPTKEQSILAANSWWEAKRREIDLGGERADAPPPPSPAPAASILHQLASLTNQNIDISKIVELLLANEKKKESKQICDAIGEWLSFLETRVKIKQIDILRYDSYRQHILRFERFAGANEEIATIDEGMLERYHAHLALKIAENEMGHATANQALMTCKQFINWMVQRKWINPLGNIKSKALTIGIPTKKVEIFEVYEIRRLIEAANEKQKLFILLMINCGFYQSDISDLGESEIDWDLGIITRTRSKNSSQIVRYILWQDTLDLLKKYRAKISVKNEKGDRRVLLNEANQPLLHFAKTEKGVKRSDSIGMQLYRLRQKTKIKKSILHLRKTSATLLASHKSYKYYVQYFLAQSPKTIADKRYVIPNDEEFFEALIWLQSKYFGEDGY
jgi:integrase